MVAELPAAGRARTGGGKGDETAEGAVRRRLHGSWRVRARAALLPAVHSGTAHVAAVQSAFRHDALDPLMRAVSWAGTHEFYVMTLPLFFWFGAGRLGLHLTMLLGTGIYAGNCAKDLLALPRPSGTHVDVAGDGEHAREFGWPSTHAVCASVMPFYIFIFAFWAGGADGASPETADAVRGPALVLAVFTSLLLAFSRLYLGMHSPVDIAAGFAIGGALLAAWCAALGPLVDALVASDAVNVPLWSAAAAVGAVVLHPVAPARCPCYTDSVCFIGTLAGAVSSLWAFRRAGVAPVGPTGDLPFDLAAASPAVVLARVALGLTTTLVARSAAKAASGAVARRLVSYKSPHHTTEEFCEELARSASWYHAVDALCLTRLVTYAVMTAAATVLSPAAFHAIGI